MYQDYLREPLVLSFGDADRCFSELQDVTKKFEKDDDGTLNDLYQDFIKACLRYAKIRAEWDLLTREEKLERDSDRTSAHNQVIGTHNILARYMTNIGLSTTWYSILGYDETDKISRKRIGDFACYVALFLGLQAR